jgi:hypothetical protein
MPWWKDVADAAAKLAQDIADATQVAAQAVAAAAAAAAQAAADAAAAVAQAAADAAAAVAQAAADAAAAVAAAATAAAEAADAAAQAVADAANAAADAVGGAIETAANAVAGALYDVASAVSGVPVIGGALRGLFNMLGRFTAGAGQVIALGVRAVVNMSAHALAGLIRIGGGLGGLLAGDGRIFVKGFRGIGASVVGGTIATLASVVGLVQSTFFLQRRERPLKEDELAMLVRVYRGSVAFGNVRIVEGTAGLFSLSSRAFTMGNWIYAKGTDFATEPETLVHECGHVWQNQHEGTTYIGNAIFAQVTLGNNAYQWWLEHSAGKAWNDFNKEAQAEFVDDVFQFGAGASSTGLGSFYEDDPLGPAISFQRQGTDFTAFARTSIAAMRAA